MLPQTLWVCLCSEGLASCPPSIPALNLLLPPLLQNSLSTEWRDMTETSHLGLSAPRPFTLCTLSNCRSLDFIPIYCNGMFLQWYPSGNWSISRAECHWESFWKHLFFSLGPWPFWSLLPTQSWWRWVPSHGVSLKSNQWWLVTPTRFGPLLLWHILQGGHHCGSKTL